MSTPETKPTLVIPGITDQATLACIARSRKYSQYVKAVTDALAGKCPFCDLDATYNKVIQLPSSQALRVWPCKPPEKYTKHHFIICPVRHVKDTLELTDEEWREVREAIRDLVTMFGFSYRGLLVRDGDATQSAGTIQHLHIHVMVPDGTGRVESPFCKTLEEEQVGVARAIIFEKLRIGTALSDLLPEEQELVKDRL